MFNTKRSFIILLLCIYTMKPVTIILIVHLKNTLISAFFLAKQLCYNWIFLTAGRGDDSRAWGPPWLKETSAYFVSVNRNKKVFMDCELAFERT